MAFISVTRLRVRSVRFLPAFLIDTIRSSRQVQRAGGYRGGWLGSEWPLGFWTATAWDSRGTMRAFRNAPPHLEAMGRLLRWCDEASFVHWEQPGFDPPDGETAHRRLGEEGRVSKVLHPSERHRAGRTVGEKSPRPGTPLRPK